MRDQLFTLIAYAGISVVTGWWFWRAHSGFLNHATHAAVSVLFGLLWPVSVPWLVLVRAVNGVIAGYRARRIRQPVDDRVATDETPRPAR